MRVKLLREWVLGDRIGTGGFGQVFEATAPDADDRAYVVKLVPKAPGAQRELLFVSLDRVRNVIPIIESGEHENYWALVMPRAEKSLRKFLIDIRRPLDAAAAIPILIDIATTLADLDGKIVHRDLKPENVLLLDGRWCLADFGISRYAEATTAPDTQKYSLSAPYAAPERWRMERVAGATDVYALGIIGFELLAGAWPFAGPDLSDFRDQHLHADPKPLSDTPAGLASVIAECLYKSAGARPGLQNILARLASARHAPGSAGRARLQQANLQQVARLGESTRQHSAQRSEAERRHELFRDASASFKQISDELKSVIAEHAPAAIIQTDRNGGWTAQLDGGRLKLTSAKRAPENPWDNWKPPAFDVIASASIFIGVPKNRAGYEGRGHSLWFGDVRESALYGWFETAFMLMALTSRSSSIAPFPMEFGEGAAMALGPGLAEYQLAWPFMALSAGDTSEFVDRWIGWLADASQGKLHRPSTMPERSVDGSWRRQHH